MFLVTEEPIDIPSLMTQSVAPENGAIATFIGIVRNHSGEKKVQKLFYEAYIPMALKSFEEIGKEARNLWQISELSIVHRVGTLSIGEPAVFILTSAPHRKEALSACAYTIDRIKEISPLWKKEII